MAGANADLSTRKYRERELYTIPISSSWFKWDDIHDLEKRSLPEFFDGNSYTRSPRVYKEYRDFMINKYREDLSRRLTFTDIRKCLVGDVGSLRKVFLFLEKCGLINFSVFDGEKKKGKGEEEDGGPVVVVEVGPAAGVRVVSSACLDERLQGGGESGFRLSALSSYSDAFGEWNCGGGGFVCGLCGDHYGGSGSKEPLKGGIAMCSKCSTNDTMNGKNEDHLMPNDCSDVKDQPSPVWTDAETLLLLEAVLKHGDDWDLIAQHVRTKNKLDCISRLIHLPFGEHMLGTISTKSSKTNLSTPLEFKPSLQLLNDNPPVITETGSDQQVEINKTRGAEIVNLGHPLKRRCFPPFTDTTDSFMKKVASLSTVRGQHVAAVAVDAATRVMCQENPSAWLEFETNEDKTAKPVSPTYKNEFKSDINDVDDGNVKKNKQAGYVPEKSFGATTFQLRAAAAASLAAAAARAKLVADQEEREMELLMASIIQAQVKKLQYKMKHLMEVEEIMEKELGYVQEMKELVMEEWTNLLHNLFHAGIPRWRDQPFSKTMHA